MASAPGLALGGPPPELDVLRALQPRPVRPFLLVDVAAHRMERERVEVPGFPAWAAEHQGRPDFSGWLGSTWFTPSSPKAPRVAAQGRRVVMPSTGEIFACDVMELRSPYLGEVYAGGRSRPRWSHKDLDALTAFSRGLSMPNANRGGLPGEPLVELDAYSAWWQVEMAIGTGCELDPATGRWWGGGDWPAAEDFRATKLYISTLSHAFNTYHGRRFVRGEPKEERNPYFQPQYVHLVTRIWHAWAQEMVSLFEGWRVTTDAVWVPERLAAQAIAWSWERWHIALRVKRAYVPGQAKWGSGAPSSSIIPQPEAVREALSSSIRGDLPRSPLTPPMSFQEREQMANCNYPSTSRPPLGWDDDPPPQETTPRGPEAPRLTIAERRARHLAYLRAQYEAGELVPPPLQPWQAAVRDRLVTEGEPDPFLPPPEDEPWMTGGWSLVRADIPAAFSWGAVRWGPPDEDDLPGDGRSWGWDSRAPPVDWSDDGDF